jgi:hypothetical protein
MADLIKLNIGARITFFHFRRGIAFNLDGDKSPPHRPNFTLHRILLLLSSIKFKVSQTMRFIAIVTALMAAGVFSAPVPQPETYDLLKDMSNSSADLAVRTPEAEPQYGDSWKRDEELETRGYGTGWKRDEEEKRGYGDGWKRDEELDARGYGTGWKRDEEEKRDYGTGWKRDEELDARGYGTGWKRDEEEKRGYGTGWKRDEEEKRDVAEV